MQPRSSDSDPAEAGFRWPAEWERHRATWLAWPHNPGTWPGHLAPVEDAFLEMVRVLHGVEQVCIAVADEAREAALARRLAGAGLEAGVELHRIPTDDAWIRDTGPLFLLGPRGELGAAEFRFDAWGGKYPPWERDRAVARRVAEARGARHFRADFVLEGGSVEGNGEGTVLTTTSCLLHPNREVPGRTREQMEARLRAWLGAECVLWLGDGIVGDDTDGHIDDIARFVDATTVVAAHEPDPRDANHAPLEENLRRLRGMRDARGRLLAVVPLPMPPPLVTDGARCPASYANFYLANERALVPVFGVPEDDRALRVLREVLPGRELAPIPARALVMGLGAVHCLTQQEPATAAWPTGAAR